MESLEGNFLNLQKVLECAIEHNGGNQYKLPHMKKKKLRKANKLQNQNAYRIMDISKRNVRIILDLSLLWNRMAMRKIQ
jgi:hypothetical protein